MSTQDKPGTYVQASFRLTPDTHETIKAIAQKKEINQSAVMREAAMLLKQTVGLPPNLKLAVVDVDDSHGPNHYRVRGWLIVED